MTTYSDEKREGPQGSSPVRGLRERLRSHEGEASRLRLLLRAANAGAQETAAKSALRAMLLEVLQFSTADAGVVLQQESGGLTVMAAQGGVLPVGARIPLGGVLSGVMRPPFSLSLREHVSSRLWMQGDAALATELIVPLLFGGRLEGVLAIISAQARLTLSDADFRAIEALCTLLAAVLHRPAAGRARGGRRDGAAALAQLSPREQQVFALLPKGLSNAEMAEQLGIATGTAKIHVERILHKLGVRDRTQAAVRAVEWGFK